MRSLDALPRNARQYVERLEELVNVPVKMISVGAGREETILIRPTFFKRCGRKTNPWEDEKGQAAADIRPQHDSAPDQAKGERLVPPYPPEGKT